VNPVETFSSDGLRRMFYKPNGTPFTPGNFSSTGGIILNKPDIAAADGGSTSVPGFGSFFGTSAAAPHAAAIAALLLSFNPALTPAQIRAALASSALDIEGAGFDRDSGSGIVMAFGAMKVINPCTIVCPANISVSNDPGQCGAIVKYPNPRTRGGCGGVTCNPPSGFFFPKGITKVTCTSASEDSCSFTVTVKDTEPPQITCPADITVGNDPGQCSAVVTYTVKVTDNCPGATVVCVPPSGAVFPKGTTLVNCTAKDEAGNKANCGFSVTVKDIEPPVVTASVAQASLWPPNHNLINVGLTVTATDNCPGPLPITVNVYSDEDDETATGDGNFSPDAKDVAPNTLRLRQERKGDDDGRVYLIVSSTTDGSGNVGFACTTVVVPHSKNPADIASVDAQAAAAMAWCQTHNGSAPPGFVVVGDGPIVGPKQ
jgi:hypothetical protein